MYGAILGDIIGSPYEGISFSTTITNLFLEESTFTDDTIMTIAVADALTNIDINGNDDDIRNAVANSMKKWGLKYPNAGYGGSFYTWLYIGNEPYYSYGNGSAMRVSSVAWACNDINKVRHLAKLTAEVTHNHPEGIKGAEALASAIFLARNGNSKQEIKDYITNEFGYDLSKTCEDISDNYCFDVSCQATVPQAITAFLEGEGFEDVIAIAISLGGDTDTLAAMAGSIAEAYYGITDVLIEECNKRLTVEMLKVINIFKEKFM